MTFLHALRDWMSNPVTWVTWVITLLGSAMVAFACPIGMPANDGPKLWIAFSWAGVFLAQLISLGAWAALRDGRWVSRIWIPAALLIMFIIACSIGERMNSIPTNGTSAVVSLGAFGSAYFLFLLFRRFGWRIGPSCEGTSIFGLKHLFLAITFVGIALAIWTWTATDSRGHIALSLNRDFLLQASGALLGTSIATLLFCLFAIPAIAVVMDGRMRYVIWLFSVLLIATVLLVASSLHSSFIPSTFRDVSLATIMVPIVFVVVTMWLFYGYRMCNYHFIGPQSPQPSSRRWFFVGVGFALAGIMYSAIALGEFRVKNALKRPLMQLGVAPSGFKGSQITGASFYRSDIGITRPGVEALKQLPSLRELAVQCAASPEQIGWLAELQTLELVMVFGKNYGDPHLRSLYQAKQLKRLELHDTSASIEEVKQLQQVLVNCEIRMINAGTLIVGPSVPVRKQQDIAP